VARIFHLTELNSKNGMQLAVAPHNTLLVRKLVCYNAEVGLSRMPLFAFAICEPGHKVAKMPGP
jgi:hypothetical protein